MGSTVKEEQSSKMFAPLNTGDNMQIVFSEEVWVTKLTAGDEILSYDSSHNLIVSYKVFKSTNSFNCMGR